MPPYFAPLRTPSPFFRANRAAVRIGGVRRFNNIASFRRVRSWRRVARRPCACAPEGSCCPAAGAEATEAGQAGQARGGQRWGPRATMPQMADTPPEGILGRASLVSLLLAAGITALMACAPAARPSAAPAAPAQGGGVNRRRANRRQPRSRRRSTGRSARLTLVMMNRT